jgi:anti-sigma factor (TIGR02949 family)
MSGHECDDALTQLYHYLDQELEASSLEMIRLHLEDCSGCLRNFDFETRLKIVVRQRLAEDVPLEFLERLRQALAREASSAL